MEYTVIGLGLSAQRGSGSGCGANNRTQLRKVLCDGAVFSDSGAGEHVGGGGDLYEWAVCSGGSTDAVRITFSNVAPFISDEFLEKCGVTH